jgi:hypothetical protein
MTKIETSNEKVEILRGTLVSRMDIHQAKIEANHGEWMVAMQASHEGMEALIDVSLETMEPA